MQHDHEPEIAEPEDDDFTAAELDIRIARPFALVAYRDENAELPEKMADGLVLDDGSAHVYGIQPDGRSFTGDFISADSAADRLDAIPVFS